MKLFRLALSLALVLSLSMSLMGCSGKEERIGSHLARGQKYLERSELDKTMVEVRNVLQMDPKRAEAYYLAGQAEESRADIQRAYAAYSKAIELKPNYSDAKAATARLQLAVGDLANAKKTITDVLAADPNNVEARVVKAALVARQGDIDQAIALANGIKVSDRLPASASLLLANLYARKNDFPQALQVIQTALVTEPKDLRLLSAAADISRQLNQNENVNLYYQRAVAAAPKNYSLWRAWANDFDQRGKYEDAERVLRAAIKADSDDSSRYLALATFLGVRKGPEAERAELVSISNNRPRDYQIKFALVNYYRARGQIEYAQKVLEGIVASDRTGPAGLSARNDLASFDLEAGRESQARTLLDEILKINPRDATGLVQRGRLELAHQQLDPAISDLRSAAKDLPDSTQVLSLLAQAYEANKQHDLARDTIADSVKMFPNRPELGLLQGEYLARTEGSTDALAAYDAVIHADPGYVQAYAAKAALQVQSKDTAAAEATLKAFIEAYPNNPVGPMNLGQLYAAEKKMDLALTEFDRAASIAPSAIEPREAAQATLIAAKRFPEAEQRVEAVIKGAPKSAAAYEILGNLKIAEKDSNAAESAFRKAIELEPTAVVSYVRLANLFAQKNDSDNVVAVLDQGVKANPGNDALQIAEADFFSHGGRYDRAITIYEQMLQRDPENILAANNLAYLLTEQKGDTTSLDRALALTQRFQYSGNAGLLDTLGWIHYKLGQFKLALPLLQQAQALSPDAAIVQLHYGMALYKTGDVDQAKKHLKIAAQAKPPLPNIGEANRIIDQG